MNFVCKKTKLVVLYLLLSIFFVSSVYADTLFVGTNGDNANGNGSSTKPWKTISYALTMAKKGDTISINNGTYSEGQLNLPVGVSLTSTSKDNTKVTIQPNKDLDRYTPLIKVSSSSPGSPGNQSISYLELDGQNGAIQAVTAIKIQNRNDVSVHHCNIHDFNLGYSHAADSPSSLSMIWVGSTQTEEKTDWRLYWPENPQEPGNDANINALWPKNPVQNFEFAYNTVKACYAIHPYNLKNSSIHDNTIDNGDTYLWVIQGVPAILDNVDIYNNKLTCKRADAPKNSFLVEIWLFKGGCQIYNNVSNGLYSVTVGKGTKFFNNTIDFDPPGYTGGQGGYALEFTMQNYSEVYNNYIAGPTNGITLGVSQNAGKNFIAEHMYVHDNVIYNPKEFGIFLKSKGNQWTDKYHVITRHVDIRNNIIVGNPPRGLHGIRLQQHDDLGTSEMNDVSISDNIITNFPDYAGATTGTVADLRINSNNFYKNTYDSWKGSTALNTTYIDQGISLPPEKPSMSSLLLAPTLSVSPK